MTNIVNMRYRNKLPKSYGQTMDEFFDSVGFDRHSPHSVAHSEDFNHFEDIADELRSARIAAGITQQQVATFMETTQSTISALEKVQRNPTIETLMEYARAIGFRVKFSLEPVDALALVEESSTSSA